MTPKELREKRAKLKPEMEKLQALANEEGRDWTDEDEKAWQDLKGQWDRLTNQIEKAETVDAITTELESPVGDPRIGREPFDGRTANQESEPENRAPIPAQPHRGRVLKAFTGPDAEQRAYRSGLWLAATLLRHPWAAERCRQLGVETRVMGEATLTAGGYLVPPELSAAIIDLREKYGIARQVLNVVPMSTDTLTIPRRTAGTTAYPVGESDAITASDASFNQVQLTARKWGGLTRMSNELVEDALIDIADWVADEHGYAFAVAEDDALFNGDGSSTYHGIVGIRAKIIDGTHTAGAVDGASGHDTFAEIDATDLTNVMAALPQYALATAKWYCSQPAYAVVFQRLMAAGGGNTLGDLAGPAQYNYLGFPIVISQKMPTALTDISDTAMLLFGDINMAVTMGERRGLRMRVLQERYAEYDQIAVIATERMDINVHDLGSTTVGGPIVALIGE